MIVKSRTEKKCDICKRVLADKEKELLPFRNIRNHTTIYMDVWTPFGNDQIEMHICEMCFNELTSEIKHRMLKEDNQ